jgi:hypothetical protein
LEGLSLSKGQSIELEEFFISEGQERAALLENFSQKIKAHHHKLHTAEVPSSWCSWYYYGPDFVYFSNNRLFRQLLWRFNACFLLTSRVNYKQ